MTRGVDGWLVALAPADRRIVDVAVHGGTLREVAAVLGVSEAYVGNRLSLAYGVLGVSGRPELIALYWQFEIRDVRGAPA